MRPRFMTLRDRLLLFAATQLFAFGVLFVVVYAGFRRDVAPMLLEDIRNKAAGSILALASELDIALAADDPQLLHTTVASLFGDPDFQHVEIRDPAGRVLYVHGTAPRAARCATAAREVHEHRGFVHAWSRVSLESMQLGTVAVAFSTARADRLQAWTRRLTIAALAVWIAALAYSILFSRAFVRPIRDMMVFSRRVAHGDFDQELSSPATGELQELTELLNAMTRELHVREEARQEAASRVESMQRDLVAASRVAGMAEVATGVLHNVGNVLNSLNVSVSVARNKLQASKASALARSVALLEGHPGGVEAFLATPKGKLLPAYLAAVSRQLGQDNAEVLGELSSMAHNVDHIKTIVAAQQSYAQTTPLREPVPLPSVIDDALRMGEVSFSRHGVEVVRDYDAAPVIVTDRHKLLQILVNLVSNAGHALEGGGGHLCLTVRARGTATGVAISVEDTGVGISAENLTQIFQHGFTTKKGGHGFGLHASANAARELGGSLTARSGGRGTGATFTVELPLEPPREHHASP